MKGNRIKINNDYMIGSDSNQWMIMTPRMERNKDTNELEEVWRAVSYYSRLDTVVKNLGERMLRESNENSVSGLELAASRISELLSRKFNMRLYTFGESTIEFDMQTVSDGSKPFGD